ncbi:unnamed protein product [Merluccius merluccius]
MSVRFIGPGTPTRQTPAAPGGGRVAAAADAWRRTLRRMAPCSWGGGGGGGDEEDRTGLTPHRPLLCRHSAHEQLTYLHSSCLAVTAAPRVDPAPRSEKD